MWKEAVMARYYTGICLEELIVRKNHENLVTADVRAEI
jgi:hypothetical protein